LEFDADVLMDPRTEAEQVLFDYPFADGAHIPSDALESVLRRFEASP
jgi:hypothetical protein